MTEIIEQLTQVFQVIGPDAVFFVLMLGVWLIITAIYAPGTGFPEVGAAVALSLSLAGLFYVPVNPGWLILMTVGLGFFLALVYYRQSWWLIAAGYACLVVGAFFLFQADSRPTWWMIIGLHAASFAYHQLILYPGLRIQGKASETDADALIGAFARVTGTIDGSGTVVIRGETWRARSGVTVEAGDWVRVTGRKGLWLTVEPAQPPTEYL